MVKVLSIDPKAPDADLIGEAVDVLRAGGLVAFPTETVYGLGALAGDPRALERLAQAKRRPPDKPFTLLVAGLEAALALCAESHRAILEKLGRRFWPGPLTVVVPATARGVRHDPASGIAPQERSVGLRVPDHPVALPLLMAVGEPIAAPSANPAGAVESCTGEAVLQSLGYAVDLILDAGEVAMGQPSTVVDLTGVRPVILRQGPISLGEIEEALARSGPGQG